MSHRSLNVPMTSPVVSRPRWTPEENAYLRENYGSVPRAEIAGALGRSLDAVYHQASRLGVRVKQRWTETEIRIISEHQGTRREAAAILGRGYDAVQAQVSAIGAVRAPRWSEEDLAYLKAHWAPEQTATIARHLGRTPGGIMVKASVLGLRQHAASRFWSEKDLAYLNANWERLSTADLAAHLDRSESAVRKAARHQGLRRRPTLSPDAEELLWELRETEGVVEYFARHFGRHVAAIERVLRRLAEAGGPRVSPDR